MNGVWRSLLWKEWREHRWKGLLLLVAALPSLAVPYLGQTGASGVLISCLTFTMLAASLFLGAGAAASEQSQRTVGFLQSLPISTKWSAVTKLASALATLWLPLSIFFIANTIWRGRPSYPTAGVPTEIFAIIFGLSLSSLLIWMAATGVNLSDEIRAGAIGFLVIVGCWAMAAWLPQLAWGRASTVLDRVIYGLLPGGVWFIAPELDDQAKDPGLGPAIARPSLWLLVTAAILSNSALAASYVWRFGRVASSRRQPIDSAAKSIVPAWLAPPMRRPWKAILWKQICESLPLALMGAGAILCVSLIVVAMVRQTQEGFLNDDLLEMSIPVWMMIGALVSIVSGIGLWLDDLRPELHSFWRSRPISPDLWFTVKFSSSAIITIATLALPSLLIFYAVAMLTGRPAFSMYASNDWSTPVVIGLLSQFGFFCVAAALMATIRRPMVAALLTILLAAIVTFGMIGPLALEVVGIAATVAAISCIAIAINWLSVRYDRAIGR